MKTLNVISTFVLSIFLISCDTSSQVTENEDLITSIKESFVSPPESARPWVYWFWLNSNVTREGITADLEAMKRVGIGGVLIMDVDQGTPASSMKFMDEQWQEMFRFSVQEASRLGLQINMNNDAGWNGSGGPWITPEFAMQTVTFSETRVQGGDKVNVNLPQPPTKGDYYRDVAVLAVQDSGFQMVHMMDAKPSLSLAVKKGRTKIPIPTDKNYHFYQGSWAGGNTTDSLPKVQNRLMITASNHSELPSLDIHFDSPFAARMLDFTISGLFSNGQGELQISNDGIKFKSLKIFPLKNRRNLVEFDLIKASWFRIKFLKIHEEQGEFIVHNLEVHPRYQIKKLPQKALFSLDNFSGTGKSAPLDENAPEGTAISQEKVVDISQYMDANGHLEWDAPKGKWSILRYGHTFTGIENRPAPPGGKGPDCDKLSKKGIRKHYEGMMKKLVELAGDDTGKAFTTFHADSWEVGAQNWTRNMGEEFRKRRGYDITPYLPIFSERVIGSQQQTERFLWDLRKTVSELMVENYVAEIQKICHENGMQFSMESYITLGNDLDAANWVDEPMAEFWTQNDFSMLKNTMKSMASAAHINNRPIVAAESFTSYSTEKWLFHPASIKALGDSAFCKGVNKFVFHRYAMQPWLNQGPGMTMGPWGLHYERTQTWWEYSLPWHTYLARCQYLLRQGKFIADVLDLQPEEPNYRFKNLDISGYDYNACSPDAFQKVSVEDGMLIDGAGNKYKLLVLTHLGTMSEQMLSHIRELVVQGASVLGEPPMATPGLMDYPNADARLELLAEELWGKGEALKQERKVGKGRVFNGISPEEALKRMGIAPDFISENKLNYIHREINGADVYFVANGADSAIVANCTFRVKGKRPQWWNPETGETKPLANYAPTNEGTIRVPLELGPSGSGFVVFIPETDTNPERVSKITRNGEVLLEEGIAYYDEKTGNPTNGIFDFVSGEISLSGSYVFTKASGGETNTIIVSPEQKTMGVSGPWELKFPQGSGTPLKVDVNKLESWTSMPDKEVNYFSGTGSYFKTISIPSGLIQSGTRLYLDLGKVEVVARVFINGEEAGTCWKPPYRIDVTSMVHEGENDLRVDVANLWVNRQIGDEYLPEDSERNPNGTLKTWPDWVLEDKESPTGRQSFTTWRLWEKDDPLLESGLIGPVTLQQMKLSEY